VRKREEYSSWRRVRGRREREGEGKIQREGEGRGGGGKGRGRSIHYGRACCANPAGYLHIESSDTRGEKHHVFRSTVTLWVKSTMCQEVTLLDGGTTCVVITLWDDRTTFILDGGITCILIKSRIAAVHV
jgi:hypothetical protein